MSKNIKTEQRVSQQGRQIRSITEIDQMKNW